MRDLVGERIHRYHLLELLGQGGMAVVYRARDTRLGRDVAIKLIRRGAIMPDKLAVTLKRFEQEAKAMAQMEHDHIISIHDYGEFEGQPYVVMAYISGGTLKDLTGEPVPYQQAIKHILPIMKALAFAHESGVVHRDVKPANILMTEKGMPMLSDFGIAKVMKAETTLELTKSGVLLGTPAYMAPEQWHGDAGPGVDIYALGVILYELVTGARPYSGSSSYELFIKISTEPVQKPGTLIPNLPQGVENTILKAMAIVPGERYASMGAFVSELESFVVEDDVPEKIADWGRTNPSTVSLPEEKPAPRTWWRSRSMWLVGAVILAVGVLITATVFATGFYSLMDGRGALSAAEGISQVNTPVLNEEPPTPFTQTVTETLQPEITPSETAAPSATSTPSPTSEPTLGIGSTMVSPRDGMILHYVPEGMFDMGSEEGDMDERPVHKVYLPAYWVDRTEVTNRMYAAFLNENGNQQVNTVSWLDEGDQAARIYSSDNRFLIDFGYDDHPVTEVTWYGAAAYCEWAGRRLPTEAEWEKAARGIDGRTYPWGEGIDNNRANYDYLVDDTSIAGSFPDGSGPYGSLDMAGNVWEWTADWYAEDYYRSSPPGSPEGPVTGERRILRGGCWRNPAEWVRSSFRVHEAPGIANGYYGFRCVYMP